MLTISGLYSADTQAPFQEDGWLNCMDLSALVCNKSLFFNNKIPTLPPQRGGTPARLI